MKHHEFVKWFAGSWAELAGQSILIYGKTGTLKTRLAATFGVIRSIACQKPTLYFGVSESLSTSRSIFSGVGEAWARSLPFESSPLLVNGDQAAEVRRSGAQIRFHGVSATWPELQSEMETCSETSPDAAVVIVDSMGFLGPIDRLLLGNLLQYSPWPDALTIFVGEESTEQSIRTSLAHAQAIADIVLHLGFDLPETGCGPHSRWMQIEKTRHYDALCGRYCVAMTAPSEIINVYPPVEFWDSTQAQKLLRVSP